MGSQDAPITADIVKARADLAGVTIDEEKLEDIAYMMEQSLAPLRSLDLRAIRLVEPAVSFQAGWSE